MRLIKILLIFLVIIVSISITSCIKEFTQPDNDNHGNVNRLLSDPSSAEGVLLNAYADLPNGYSFDEAATDDAVTNIVGSPYMRMATGEWSARFDPLSVWSPAYQNIYYLNYFLNINDKVKWAWDDRDSPAAERSAAFRKRYKGEALALRAWYNFELLKRHGGIAIDGKPTGFIIMKSIIEPGADFNIARNSYDDCVKFILADIDTAITLLPDEYSDNGNDIVHNLVLGSQNKNRINGKFARALKSRVTLYVASQPFNNNSDYWKDAAISAEDLLKDIDGVAGISPSGSRFWLNKDDPEILFRRDYTVTNSLEKNNFPPSLYGNGQTNPSQNLIDAFPMANGFPIQSSLSGYSPQNPYNQRDPRLKSYIMYNGNNYNGRVINTNVESSPNGLNQTISSTRTGYYLSKLLDPTINVAPSGATSKIHFYTIFRYTEIFLNYAEAANEAWGPDLDPMGYGITPVQIIAAIRKRGGISQPDNYLLTRSSSQQLMRELIRNERRIELCFEGFRFWDIRRWGLNLNEPVDGMSISNGLNTRIHVEARAYQPFMNYGPIPELETLKANKIIQNAGW